MEALCLLHLASGHIPRTSVGFATGTTVLALPPDAVLQCEFVAPPLPLILAFESMVTPLIERMSKAGDESKTLATVRDTLLAKLITGELNVKDAERTIEAIV